MTFLRAAFVLVGFVALSTTVHAQTVVEIGSGFFNPYGVALDSAGNVVVVDTGSSSVKRILVAGGYTTVETLLSGVGGAALLAVDSADNLYFNGDALSPIVRSLAAGGYATPQPLLPQFSETALGGFALDSARNIFVSNPFADVVRRYAAAGNYQSPPLVLVNERKAFAVALDAASNIYVTETQNNQVTRFLAAGNYTTVQTLGSGFQRPTGIAVHSNGDVFVGESPLNGAGAVKRIAAAGGYTNVTTLATENSPVYGIAVDAAGDVYFTTTSGHKVKKILMSVAPTTTAVSSNINPSVFRQTVAFTATVTGNNPTGTVNVFAGPNLLCGAPLLTGSNQVSCSFTGLLAMSHSITAVYGGNATNGASTSAPITQVVNQASTAVAVAAPGPITIGQSTLVTATVAVVAPGGGTPTGVIAVSDGSVNCTIILPATTCSLTPTSVGPRTVTASYGGDANYLASSNTTTLGVLAPTATTLTSSSNPSVRGQGVTFTATVSGTAPGGTVNFLDGAAPLCTGVALAGQAQCTVTTLSTGAHAITAAYSGDASNAASTSNVLTQTVNAAATITSVSAPGPITLGESATITATVAVAAPGAGAPTGTIAVSDGSASCSILLPATTCSLTPTSAGPRTVTASYGGDANYLASSSTATLSVIAVATTALASNANPSVYGQSVSFTATVTGNAPSGTVNFLDGAAPFCTAVTLDAGQALCTLATLSTGTHSITAAYSGDANNVASTSNVLTQVVDAAATLTSVSVPGPIDFGASVSVTATVVAVAPGAGTPSGTIVVSDGAANCSIALPATSCSLTPPAAGNWTLTAAYSGDADFAASTGAVTLVVNGASQTITVVAPATVALNESPVSIDVSASSGLPVTVTSNTPGTCTVSGNGPFSVTLVAPGVCTLVAQQAGDGNTQPATVTITLTITGEVVGGVASLPTLDRWALLGVILLLGMVGGVRATKRSDSNGA